MGFFGIFDRTPAEPAEAQLNAVICGKVQGVGFRWWTAGEAKPLGLTGYAKNLDDGTVEILAQGRRESCQKLLTILESGNTAGHVEQVQAEIGEPEGNYKTFSIQ